MKDKRKLSEAKLASMEQAKAYICEQIDMLGAGEALTIMIADKKQGIVIEHKSMQDVQFMGTKLFT